MKLCLFGAAPDTGNLGVSALCYGTLAGLARAQRDIDLTVFDFGSGVRTERLNVGEDALSFTRCGGYLTRRIYRRESMWNVRWSARLGGMGNAGARAILNADAIMDISGGDSFADLYGPKRFQQVAEPKLLALEIGKPLVLLPQTYGPFKSAKLRETAARIVRGSAMAWSRDERSFEVLRELAGDRFDPSLHRSGVDVAFGLDAIEPESLPKSIQSWLAERDGPLLGLNISGLIYLDSEAARTQYGLKADYRAVIDGLLRRLLKESAARIILMPHVITPEGHYESDPDACKMVMAALGPEAAERVAIAPVNLGPGEAKWLISGLDWFCGTRMHSTIAALSSGVPVAAIAYSIKTAGVFETCGLGNCVMDPRVMDTTAVVEGLWGCWQDHERCKMVLRGRLPMVMGQVEEQARLILECCKEHVRPSKSRIVAEAV